MLASLYGTQVYRSFTHSKTFTSDNALSNFRHSWKEETNKPAVSDSRINEEISISIVIKGKD